ncbi:MAG: hypothetical protein FVQ81_05385 [Candidatus Glassbacteria bacterium]|nr:hypothetical protein [Candidatus Glassbacteria bacterium]
MTETTRTVMLILLLAFIALTGGRLILRKRTRQAVPLLRLHTAMYLVVGVALGRHGLGLLASETLVNLEPLLQLALGWAGLMFGLQFNRRSLRQFPPSWAAAAGLQAVVTVLVLALVMGSAFIRFFDWEGARFWLALLLVTVAGAASSPAEPALAASGSGRIRKRFAQFVNYAASLDPVLPIVILGAAAGWFHAGGGGLVPALEWTAASILTGLAMGFMFYSYARHKHTEKELAMMIIAFAILAGGIAAYLKLSSLLISMVMGVLVGNSLKDTGERVFRVLVVRERPILVVLLVIVGASWDPVRIADLVPVAACLMIFLAARVGAKLIGAFLFSPLVREEMEGAGAGGGLALIGQGGMSIALLANHQLLFVGYGAADAVTIVLAGLVIAEAVAAHAARLALEHRRIEARKEGGS